MMNNAKYKASDRVSVDNQTPQISPEDVDHPEFQEILKMMDRALPIDDKTRRELQTQVITDVGLRGHDNAINVIRLHPSSQLPRTKLFTDCPSTSGKPDELDSDDEGLGDEIDSDNPPEKHLSIPLCMPTVDEKEEDEPFYLPKSWKGKKRPELVDVNTVTVIGPVSASMSLDENEDIPFVFVPVL